MSINIEKIKKSVPTASSVMITNEYKYKKPIKKSVPTA
jgi:hypothetical protein